MPTEIDPATIETIESVPGLRTALEILAEANQVATETGRCVIDFSVQENGDMLISQITDHVDALESDHE